MVEHWYCSTCQKRFKDKDLTTEFDPSQETVMTPLAHVYATIPDDDTTTTGTDKKVGKYKAPTCQADGQLAHTYCTECGRKFYIDPDSKAYVQYYDDDDVILQKAGHQLTKKGDEALAAACPATCTEYGWALFYVCETCNVAFKDDKGTVEAFKMPTVDNSDENGKGPEAANTQSVPAGFAIIATVDGTEGNDSETTTDGDENEDTPTDPQPPTTTYNRPNETEQGQLYVEGKGMVVKPLGHLAETVPGEGTETNPVFFYHPTREGHYILCRRDCCYNKETKQYNRISGLLPGEKSKVEDKTFGDLEAHDYNGGNVCEKCGWGNPEEAKKNDYTMGKFIDWGQEGSKVGAGGVNNWLQVEGIVDELGEDEIIIGNYKNSYGGYNTFKNNNTEVFYGKVLDLTKYTYKITYKESEASKTKEGHLVGLGSYIFKDLNQIETVIIPWTVRFICEYAFYNCTALKNVVFEEAPEGVEAQLYIANDAFENCSSLEEVVFPSHLKGIACSDSYSHAFYGTNVMEVTFNSIIKCIKNYDSSDTEIKETGAINCLSPLGTIYACLPQEPGVSAGEQWNKQTSIGNPNSDMKAYLLGFIDSSAVQVTQEETPAPAPSPALSAVPDGDGDVVTKYDNDAVKWIVKEWDALANDGNGAWVDVKE